jgi:hypothetical protein
MRKGERCRLLFGGVLVERWTNAEPGTADKPFALVNQAQEQYQKAKALQTLRDLVVLDALEVQAIEKDQDMSKDQICPDPFSMHGSPDPFQRLWTKGRVGRFSGPWHRPLGLYRPGPDTADEQKLLTADRPDFALLLLVVDLQEIVLHPRVHLKEHFVVQNSAARDAGLPRRGLQEKKNPINK